MMQCSRALARRLARQLERRGEKMSPERYIVLVFLALILLGSALLCLPVASRNGHSCGFGTALFTATSATCVTGLSLVDTYTQWSGFGQTVLLVLIQVGGLGFMTIACVFFLMLRRRIGLKSRMLLAAALGLSNMQGIIGLVRRVLGVTAILEAGGALALAVRFSAQMPLGRALWLGVFHAVSAFCNAGFDLLGCIAPGASIAPYGADPAVCGVLMTLIVCGGIGFFVWADCIAARFSFRRLTVYSRVVLVATAVLLLVSWGAFAALEWRNPATLGLRPAGQKLLMALFEAVTMRTAGFAGFDQSGLTQGAKALSVVCMLIGGASGSTAGGMKVGTAAILLLAALQALRGKRYCSVFGRTITPEQILNAMATAVCMVGAAFFGAMVLTITDGVSFLDAAFETASAMGTVGLTCGLTPTLGVVSQAILIILMFFGRVGIMTFGVGFLLRDNAADRYHYAPAKMMIG